ncbi:hypothetical protein LUZ61_004517 [Rhynchospora tenuis]|uniref:Uncharacterized protein n=1 Tax=Rhynchospora tenuis TaxID=198213 RepID=A0AAD6ETM6_9POAL|nr:hypothetical protein LUZ61_004517 [Rhynchospora tenuis]
MESALAVAVAKTVIAKLSDSLWKELSSIWGLEKECEKLKNLFAIVSTVLEDADSKARTNELVEMWLSRLQEVAYDVEDLLDDFQIQATKNGSKTTTLGKVQRFFTSGNKTGFRYSMAKRIQKINERMDEIIGEKRNFQLLQSDFIIAAEPNAEREPALSAVNESEIYGRDEEKKYLIDHLLHWKNEEQLSSICLTGIGGVGKATLAQLICNSPEIKSYFQPIIWVDVPVDFNLCEI